DADADRVLTPGASRDDLDSRRWLAPDAAPAADDLLETLELAGGTDDDDLADEGKRCERAEGMDDERLAREREELLRGAVAASAPRCRDDHAEARPSHGARERERCGPMRPKTMRPVLVWIALLTTTVIS